jgi:integrase
MIKNMRLFTQRGIYYIEGPGGKRKSLKTRDKRVADQLFVKLKKGQLMANLFELDRKNKTTISQLSDLFIKDPDRSDLDSETHRADELALRSLRNAVGDKDLNNLRSKDITELKAACKARDLSPHSVNSYLRHIKSALRYAAENKLIDEIPKIKMVNTGVKLPRVMDLDDVGKLLDHSRDKKPEMARIMRFTLYTAMRRSEIIKARYEHIAHGNLTIYGKGNKERLIPLPDQALSVLKRQDVGKIFSYKHVSTISNYFRVLSRECGIKARFHDLRHTAATQMLKSGIPLEVVQKILGHTEIRTTQIYADVVVETMKNELKKLDY